MIPIRIAIFFGLCQLSVAHGQQIQDIVHDEPCGSIQPIYGMALRRHVFQTMRVPSSLHCLKACNNDIRCQSINHLMGKDMCELNNRTKEARPEDFIPDNTKLYIKRFKKRGRTLHLFSSEAYRHASLDKSHLFFTVFLCFSHHKPAPP